MGLGHGGAAALIAIGRSIAAENRIAIVFGLLEQIRFLPWPPVARTVTSIIESERGDAFCFAGSERRQPPHPAQVPQGGQRHRQEQRSRPTENESRPHDFVRADHSCLSDIRHAAFEQLQEDPLAEGDYFPSDLLKRLARHGNVVILSRAVCPHGDRVLVMGEPKFSDAPCYGKEFKDRSKACRVCLANRSCQRIFSRYRAVNPGKRERRIFTWH